MRANINLHNMDCMEYMKDIPDNHFDLAIVDPPYGGILNKKNGHGSLKESAKKYGYNDWDYAPDSKYFIEILRVSKNQIIWGANHFVKNIPVSRGWIFWDKKREMQDFSDGELAFTSYDLGLKKFTFAWDGFRQGYNGEKEIRIHPTQKPVALYKWLLKNYAKEGDKILDTHLGSMSIAIACWDMGFDLDGCELDPEYYEAGVKRFEQHKSQLQLF